MHTPRSISVKVIALARSFRCATKFPHMNKAHVINVLRGIVRIYDAFLTNRHLEGS